MKTIIPVPDEQEDYPEHEKLLAVRNEKNAVGSFLEWLNEHGYIVCERSELEDREGIYRPTKSRDTLLAEHFAIDIDKLEAEKLLMLERLRARHDNP